LKAPADAGSSIEIAVPEFRKYEETAFLCNRENEIMEWDFTSVGLVLIGSSITVAGIIIAALLMGIVVTGAPFLLITTTVIIVMSAILVIFSTPRSKPPI